ncbi:MAG: YqgE/AlgH family protein [Bryobacteraceae bacterium]|nr:YqgE/AlgH family protein [Bryobacteraceae bacterium]MDW8378369.1 YqgE/AlgH family protein [Bryobacterales bacterium]
MVVRAFLFALLAAQLPAQPIRPRDPAPGRLLIAKRDLSDPNFAETVVFLLDYSRKGALGLILNRPTNISVARVFRDLPSAQARSDKVFSGGPVEPSSLRALQRSATRLEGARAVIDEVYVVSESAQIDKAFRQGVPPEELRFFAGYAGWAPAQLDREIELGAWLLTDADADLVFHAKPESLWKLLIRRSESRFARLKSAPCGVLPRSTEFYGCFSATPWPCTRQCWSIDPSPP